MSKKRNDEESMVCLTPKPSQSFFVYSIQRKKYRKELFKEKREWRIEQKRKEGFFLTAFATVIKKDPTNSIREHDN